jgi:hypothetical protein
MAKYMPNGIRQLIRDDYSVFLGSYRKGGKRGVPECFGRKV